jgi:hypothetical protein
VQGVDDRGSMNTLAKLIASVAALIASLALAWIAWNGVTVQHSTEMSPLMVHLSGGISHY